jgi:L-lactate dehydrogenase (cytochrome)
MDGGFRRGTDVVIALALGARAIGIGRPAMYSLIWGDAGVEKCLEILGQEVATTMTLLGVNSIDQLKPEYVSVRFSSRDVELYVLTRSIHLLWIN